MLTVVGQSELDLSRAGPEPFLPPVPESLYKFETTSVASSADIWGLINVLEAMAPNCPSQEVPVSQPPTCPCAEMNQSEALGVFSLCGKAVSCLVTGVGKIQGNCTSTWPWRKGV